MWFLGLMLGLIFGGMLGGAIGAAVGAFFGSIGGWVLGKLIGSTNSNTPHSAVASNAQLDRLQKAVEDIHWRLARLEKKQGLDDAQDSPWQAVYKVQPPAPPTSPDAPIEPWGRDAATIDLGAPTAAERVAIAEATPDLALSLDDITTESQPPSKNAKPTAPTEPNLLWAWLTGGNTIVRVGVLILFIGMAFLVKYAAEHAMFPIELRLAAVAAGATAMLVVGWRLRLNPARAGYALTLQGAAIAILYLTVFGALRLYNLIPASLAFPLLVGIAAFSAILAIRQDAMSLAVTGAAGGFLAPILASTGGGSHVALFSYYAVLNAGIFFTAWHKAWRPLNLVGFAFTFVIGLAWGAKYYQPALFATTEPFLILFFLAYVVIAILYAFKQAPKLTHYVDGTLIFGVPIVGFGLQAGLVHEFEFGLAFSALALAAFYLSLATWLKRKTAPQLHLLIESFLALGVIFASLAIPLALDARWTSAAWALEGAAVYWIGVRQDRKLARAFGLLLQVLAGIAFINGWRYDAESVAVLNQQFIGALLLAGSAFFLNRLINKNSERVSSTEASLSPLLFGLGFCWWLIAGLTEIDRFVLPSFTPQATLIFATATALLFSLLHTRLTWREAAWPQLLLLPAMGLIALFTMFEHGHLFGAYGWIVWPLALVTHVFLLKRHEPEISTVRHHYFVALHAATLLLLALIGAVELHWLTRDWDLQKSAWSVASVMLIPCGLLFWASSNAAQTRWPVSHFAKSYTLYAGVPLIVALGLWSLIANFSSDGLSTPLPYLPLMNAIDLGHIFALLTALTWWRCVSQQHEVASQEKFAVTVASVIGFIWLNAILLRTLHHVADIDYRFETMMRSVLVQGCLSIFWTVIALTIMVIAVRRIQRGLWIVGAVLMAVVVAKLLLIDFSNLTGFTRIISFIGVGLLMLVIGYFAPVPPANIDIEKEA
jgi:uncharacterized membrane protein